MIVKVVGRLPGPSRIEYSSAFDHAASWLGDSQSPLLAVLSTAEFVDLALARATEGLALVCEDAATRAYAEQRIHSPAVPSHVAEQSQILRLTDWATAGDGFGGVLWASPQPASWRTTLAALSSPELPGVSLCILTGTVWGKLIRPLRVQSHAGEPASLARQLREALALRGWTVKRARAFGGLTAAGCAAASRFCAWLGRTDLADRAEHAHRRASETNLEVRPTSRFSAQDAGGRTSVTDLPLGRRQAHSMSSSRFAAAFLGARLANSIATTFSAATLGASYELLLATRR